MMKNRQSKRRFGYENVAGSDCECLTSGVAPSLVIPRDNDSPASILKHDLRRPAHAPQAETRPSLR